jgi:hypothetical protein
MAEVYNQYRMLIQAQQNLENELNKWELAKQIAISRGIWDKYIIVSDANIPLYDISRNMPPIISHEDVELGGMRFAVYNYNDAQKSLELWKAFQPKSKVMKLSEYIQRIIDQRKQLVEINKKEIQKLEPQAQAYEKEFQQIRMQLTKPIETKTVQQTIQKEISSVKELLEKPKVEEAKKEEKQKDIIQQIVDAIVTFLRGLGLNV